MSLFKYLFIVILRIDAVEQIEDALSGLKVIEFDGVYIRLSLRTYLPKLEDLLSPQKIEDAAEPSEVNHELLIEVVNGSMELKNAEVWKPFSPKIYFIILLIHLWKKNSKLRRIKRKKNRIPDGS